MDILSVRGMRYSKLFPISTLLTVQAAGSLGPVFPDSLDPVFRPGPLPPVPSISLSLRPGQLLFVPAGSPHQVMARPNT